MENLDQVYFSSHWSIRQLMCQSTVSPQSTDVLTDSRLTINDCRSTVGKQEIKASFVDCRSTVGQRSTDERLSGDSRPIVDRLSTECRPTLVGRVFYEKKSAWFIVYVFMDWRLIDSGDLEIRLD